MEMTDGGKIHIGTFEEELRRHGRFVFTCRGNSMEPMLREERDLVIIGRRPADAEGRLPRLKRYDVALYRRGERYVLHRIVKVLPGDGAPRRRLTRKGWKRIPGDYIICGDHNPFREYDVKEEQIVGVLTAFVRDGKEISVTDRRYRWYAHVWCRLFPLRAVLLYGKRVPGAVCRRLPIIEKKFFLRRSG